MDVISILTNSTQTSGYWADLKKRSETAFSEEATCQITIRDNVQGFSDSHEAAQIECRIGGKAQSDYKEESGLKVVSSENFLGLKSGESVKELPTNDPSV